VAYTSTQCNSLDITDSQVVSAGDESVNCVSQGGEVTQGTGGVTCWVDSPWGSSEDGDGGI